MKHRNLISRFRFTLWLVVAAVGCVLSGPSLVSASGPTGQMDVPQGTVEPALDGQAGTLIFQMHPHQSPLPTHSNSAAQTPIYISMYPLSSGIAAEDLNCQPTNCDHLNVLPFPDPNYGALSGSNLACQDFNGGNPCSLVKGHDHLHGVSPSTGQASAMWQVHLVVFTEQGFENGAIDNRITTFSELLERAADGDVLIIPTPLSVTLSVVPERIYELGTPLSVTFP
jgi:hypothetical protein